MYQGRQFTLVGIVLAVLVASTLACQARSSIEAAQTAVVAAQTVLPGAQATAVAGATLVSAVLSQSQAILAPLQTALAGANVELKTTPDGAASDAVTDVAITATDSQGTLTQLDGVTRQAAGSAALALAAQYYPNAKISLSVVDTNGAPLFKASKAPGQQPTIQ